MEFPLTRQASRRRFRDRLHGHFAGVCSYRRYSGADGEERQFAAFRRLELRLYEELVSVEQAMRHNLEEMNFDPAAVLQNWCADQALRHSHRTRQYAGGDAQARRQSRALRRYGWVFAPDLSRLPPLFAGDGSPPLDVADRPVRRARDEGTPPDPLLLRITGSFLSDLEMLFDTVGSGGTPDMAEIEKLFSRSRERNLHRQRPPLLARS